VLDAQELEKYADVLLWGLKTARSKEYKEGDIILIRFDRAALALAEVVHTKCLHWGMCVIPRMTCTTGMETSFYELAKDHQLEFIAPGDRELCENVNGSIYLHAPDSLTHLAHVDSARIGKAAVARKSLRDLLDEREQQGEFGWTLCLVPTKELARQARVSLSAYTRQVARACFLDMENPVAEWERIHSEAALLKDWLNGLHVSKFQITSGNMDLTVTPGDQRRWIGISGHNIPSFEMFLSPDWRGTEGLYFADQPSYRNGNYVKGVRLEFKRGEVVRADAEEGEAFIRSQIAMDKGARRVGEFSLTDRRFSRINRFMANTLFDENFGGKFGNCHLALGSSYADTFLGDVSTLDQDRKQELGFNDSALHWDLVNTEKKTVTAYLAGGGSVVLYKNGEFQRG
jgi:aminopeptidase